MSRIKLVGGSVVVALILVSLLMPACAEPKVVEVEKVVEVPVETTVLRCAYYGPPTDPLSKSIHWACEEIASRSEDRVTFKYFWAESLISAAEQIDALESGLCDVSTLCPAYFPAKMPLYNMTFLPALFPLTKHDEEDIVAYFNIVNEWFATPLLMEEYARWNTVPWTEDYYDVYTILSKGFPAANIEDLQGKKIRAIGGTATLLESAGAVPIYTTYPEMYDALYRGTVEGLAHGWGGFYSFKIHEIADYWTPGILLGHMPSALAFNKDTYEALPDDVKGIIDAVAEEYGAMYAEGYLARKGPSLEEFKEAGVEFVDFSDEANAQLLSLAQPIWESAVAELEGKDVPASEAWNSLQDLIKKYVPAHEPYYID